MLIVSGSASDQTCVRAGRGLEGLLDCPRLNWSTGKGSPLYSRVLSPTGRHGPACHVFVLPWVPRTFYSRIPLVHHGWNFKRAPNLRLGPQPNGVNVMRMRKLKGARVQLCSLCKLLIHLQLCSGSGRHVHQLMSGADDCLDAQISNQAERASVYALLPQRSSSSSNIQARPFLKNIRIQI
jgi:hypothetical protein